MIPEEDLERIDAQTDAERPRLDDPLRAYAGGWARVLAFLFPGLGHVFLGATALGALIFLLWLLAGAGALVSRDGLWLPYALLMALIWAASLAHIHILTREF